MDNRNLPAIIPKLPIWGDPWKKSKKPRASRTPIKSKIGDYVTDPEELIELAKNKKSVTFCNTIVPACVVLNWNFAQVYRQLKDKVFRKYNV